MPPRIIRGNPEDGSQHEMTVAVTHCEYTDIDGPKPGVLV